MILRFWYFFSLWDFHTFLLYNPLHAAFLSAASWGDGQFQHPFSTGTGPIRGKKSWACGSSWDVVLVGSNRAMKGEAETQAWGVELGGKEVASGGRAEGQEGGKGQQQGWGWQAAARGRRV